jgi:hypothetical protein
MTLYMLMMQVMMCSPVIAAVVCFAIFVSRRASLPPSERPQVVGQFVIHLLVGAAIGLGGAIIYVVVATIRSNSGNGPIALLLYGPMAVSIGAVAGTLVWLRKSRVLRAG